MAISPETALFEYADCKVILDEIDRVLAAQYGFRDEELDFIINYDIKYRMGRQEEGEETAGADRGRRQA